MAAAASLPTITAFIAALIGLLAAIAGMVAIPEYRRRIKAQRAELDTQLAQLFTQLVPIADGYGQPALPDAALAVVAQKLISGNELQGVSEDELRNLREVLSNAYVSAPVGAATQAAAISSIAYLGCAYDSLTMPAEACLSSLSYARFPALEERRREALQNLKAKQAS